MEAAFGKRARQVGTWAKAFWRDNAGVTAIEYGLIAALIAVVIAAAVFSVGSDVKSVFTRVSTVI